MTFPMKEGIIDCAMYVETDTLAPLINPIYASSGVLHDLRRLTGI